jgi:beta-glucosidase
MDMTMPGTNFDKGNVLWGPQLQSAIDNRQVQQSRLDDMVKRILAAWYLLGQDKGYPTATFNSWNIGSRDVGGTHKTNVRATARDGIVLLKNTNAALPFNKPKSIAVIGLDSIVAPRVSPHRTKSAKLFRVKFHRETYLSSTSSRWSLTTAISIRSMH